eukprot:TRINITY_DN55818_c0_g1_i1.p1 TRINITY_DN55818_c0_g1~~TRINITY_DN55818_c0_g1_i1.p1  ORF type:complete len:311 (+),score=43.82 TRINITY_DN55818_c0_g1_i1:81-935(+)
MLRSLVGSEMCIRDRVGEILKLIDIVAARAAHSHCQAPSMATVSLDRLDLRVPIVDGDLVHMESQVVGSGRATCTVEVTGAKRDVLGRTWIPTHAAMLTFVALSDRGRPQKVPPMDREVCDSYAQYLSERAELTREWKKMKSQVWSDHLHGLLTRESVEDQVNRGKVEYVPMRETAIRLRKTFMPQDVNHLGSVFGGQLMLWMERSASFCARNFTRNPHMRGAALVQSGHLSDRFDRAACPSHLCDPVHRERRSQGRNNEGRVGFRIHRHYLQPQGELHNRKPG